jgi:microcystin-dependent protein
MASAYIGQISLFAGNFPPRNWAFCDGQLLSIAQNTALFSILGTNYGGNGQTTFALPDLRGRVPMHTGSSTGPGLSPHSLGEVSGAENITLISSQMPAHSHFVNGVASGGNQSSPAGNLPAIESTGTSLDYSNAATNATMNAGMIGIAGGNQPHSNMQPYSCVNFIICLYGIFPSRN